MATAKGRMAEAYTATCQTCSKSTDLAFSYTARGEVATTYESTPNSGGYYNVGMTYWPNGMVNTMSSPSFPTFTYTPDPEGRPYAVFAMTGQNPVTSTLYNTAGQTTSVTYTSGDVDTFSFDSNTGRQNGYQFKMGSLFDIGTLTWNPNGSLWKLAITDQINSANTQNCTYLYDDLGRIGLPPGSTGKSVDCGATKWQQNFSFDAFGNITKAVPTGGTGLSFSPTYNTTTNRYQTLPGFTPVYDGNGNLKADGSHTYSWDAVNNPVQLDGVGVTYDALGRMVEINATTYRTQWVYSPTGEKVELMLNGQTFAGGWIPLPGGGKRLYHISNGTVDGYTRPDWLGSARLVTSDTQTLISDVAYAPYGEDYASPSPYLQFTSGSLGENTVSASGGQGLYDFDFRKYSPAQGRWISPDPAGLGAIDPADPQSWNRYAYVGNVPTGAVDPLGLWTDAIGGGICIEGPSACAAFATNYVNGIQVSAAAAASLLGMGAAVNIGNISRTGFNTGADGNAYAYTITATDLGVGYDYFGLGYGKARFELGLPTDLAVVGRKPNPTGPNTPGPYPRLLFGTRGLRCDGKPENIVATLASTNSNAPPSQYANSFLRASASPTPGYAGNKSLTLNGSPVTSQFGNQFIQSISVSSFTTISVDWTISTIKHPSIVVSETQVAECGF